MYAVTLNGWREIRPAVQRWRRAIHDRSVAAYVGTDHGLTEPEALTQMMNDGASVHLMTEYVGIFHPKVVWLSGGRREILWVGSNNLTGEALLRNIELAAMMKLSQRINALENWFREIRDSSTLATEGLIASYSEERGGFARQQARIGVFTWSQRKSPIPPPNAVHVGHQIRHSRSLGQLRNRTW